jgi:hypothetical protein
MPLPTVEETISFLKNFPPEATVRVYNVWIVVESPEGTVEYGSLIAYHDLDSSAVIRYK